jgi:hypothetical protein
MSVQVKYTDQASSVLPKVVVYGRPKIGKTRLTATAPVPLIISTEKGTLSLRKEHVPFIEVSTIAELANAYTFLRSPQSDQYRTFTFDSISDLGEVVLGDEKKRNRDARKAYGNLQDTLMQIFRDFRDIPDKNVYFIAKEEQFTAANNMECVRPSMPGKYLTQQLPYMFDGIFHYTQLRFSDGIVRDALHTKSDMQTFAGDRSGTLDEWEPPNLAYIFDKIAKG